MTVYAAPLADMRFVMHELADLAAIGTLPGFEEATPDLVDAVLEEAGRFGAEVLAPINAVGDRQGSVYENGVVRTPDGVKDAYNKFIEGGWNALPFDPEFGGQGLPWLVHTAVGEIWTAANMAFALCPMLTQAGAEALFAHGDDTLKAMFLEKLVSGEWTGTMNLTEPQAGSDLARVRTRSVRDGNRYRLTGQKIFITWGEHDLTENVVHLVLARSPDGPPGTRGLSLFVVPKFLVNEDGSLGPRNDVRCVSIEHKMGINASPTAVLSFGDDDGAVGYLVGEENRGLEHMFTMMNTARVAVGLEGVGIADRAYQAARAYAQERVQGAPLDGSSADPVAIVHHPNVQRKLLSMKTQTEAARALAYTLAAWIDVAHHHPDPDVRRDRLAQVGLLTPVVKAWGAEVGIDVANTAVQVYGGMGYIEESGMPQHFRDARIAAIYEGTNGIQAMDLVTRKVARDGGEVARAFIATVRATDADLAEAADPDMSTIRDTLADAAGELAEATEWIATTFPTNRTVVAAGCAYYLDLMGIVAGGWLLARAALAARRHLAAGDGDPVFLEGKVKTARFFADNYLVRAGSLRAACMRAGNTLNALSVDHL